MRFNGDGSLDTTFGAAGRVIVAFPEAAGWIGHASAAAVAIDASGRILAGGVAVGAGYALVRLLPDGALDGSFGVGGKAISRVGAVLDQGGRIVLDSAGRILMSGRSANSYDNSQAFLAIQRFLPNGSLDASFGVGGLAAIAQDIDRASSGELAVDADGRVVFAGTRETASGTVVILARFLGTGQPDAAFGSGGIATLPATGSVARGLRLDAAGRLVWCGSVGGQLAVGRALATGAPDETFAEGGGATLRLSTATEATDTRWNAVATQADGKIVVAGEANGGGQVHAVAGRFSANGVPDATFGEAGVALGPSGAQANAVVLDAQKRIVTAGGGGGAFVLARLDAGGVPDAAFGIKGVARIPFPVATSSVRGAWAMAIDGAGRIVAAGGVDGALAFIRLTPDGSPDTTFNGTGRAVISAGSDSSFDGVRAMVLDASGRIVAVANAGSNFVIVRLNADGTPDASFGTGGRAASSVPAGTAAAAALAIDAGGRIVVAGYTYAYEHFVLLRYKADGSLDAGFGDAGIARATFPGASMTAGGLVIDAAGRLVVVGSAYRDWKYQLALARLLSDGTPDPTFGGNGTSTVSVIGWATVVGAALALQDDGSAIVAGRVESYPTEGLLARFKMAPESGHGGLLVKKAGTGWGVEGTVVSAPAGIDCGATCWTELPAGNPVTLTATPGALSVFTGWSGACTGSEACTLSLQANSTATATANFGPNNRYTRLANISTRGDVLTGDNVMIGGFIIGGTTPKRVLVTARGPSLADFGIASPLPNPRLAIYSGQTMIASNDNWLASSDADVAEIRASGVAPVSTWESAIVTTLAPGPYTAIVSGYPLAAKSITPPGDPVGTGVGIVEIFEQDRPDIPLVNISTRGMVNSQQGVLIGGFIVRGSTPQKVLITARGPSLGAYGIASPLADPRLAVFSGQTMILENDNWQVQSEAAGGSASVAAIQALGVFPNGLAPSNAKEAALLVTLEPGAYTVIVQGADGGTGTGIVEVFAK
jgi:uncharacterized delta-60 repeat protein